MSLPRPCDRCGDRFQPSSHTNRLCDECRSKIYHGPKLKIIVSTVINNGAEPVPPHKGGVSPNNKLLVSTNSSSPLFTPLPRPLQN